MIKIIYEKVFTQGKVTAIKKVIIIRHRTCADRLRNRANTLSLEIISKCT